MKDNIKEGHPYTIDEFALLSGMRSKEVWDRLENGELSAVVYAESDGMSMSDEMLMPSWRALPSEVVPLMRAGTYRTVEWEIRGGRVLACCDPGAVYVLPLEPDVDAVRRPRKRVTGLRAAVEAGWASGRLPIDASIAEVMEFLAQHDQSDCIVRIEATALIWLDGKDKKHKTKKTSFANQLSGWRKKFHALPAPFVSTRKST